MIWHKRLYWGAVGLKRNFRAWLGLPVKCSADEADPRAPRSTLILLLTTTLQRGGRSVPAPWRLNAAAYAEWQAQPRAEGLETAAWEDLLAFVRQKEGGVELISFGSMVGDRRIRARVTAEDAQLAWVFADDGVSNSFSRGAWTLARR